MVKMRFMSIEEACRYLDNSIRNNATLVCIGTYIRSDDRAALELCTKIIEKHGDADVILCEYGLEMCVDIIIEKRKNKIVILDAVITPMHTNSIALLSLNEVADTLPLSTHTIPLETTLGYLKTFLGDLEVEILGIPVKNLEIGFEMSSEVRELIDKLVQCLK